MNSLFIMFLANFGLSFLVSQIEGPFSLISRTRNILCRLPLLGVWFYKLLQCNFCLGIWTSLLIYLIANKGIVFNYYDYILWILAGSSFNYILHELLEKFNSERSS